MAIRHHELSPEEEQRQAALDRSWAAARNALSDPDFRSYLEASIGRVNASVASRMSADAFLATTRPASE